jgi:hypothetical protein
VQENENPTTVVKQLPFLPTSLAAAVSFAIRSQTLMK